MKSSTLISLDRIKLPSVAIFQTPLPWNQKQETSVHTVCPYMRLLKTKQAPTNPMVKGLLLVKPMQMSHAAENC